MWKSEDELPRLIGRDLSWLGKLNLSSIPIKVWTFIWWPGATRMSATRRSNACCGPFQKLWRGSEPAVVFRASLRSRDIDVWINSISKHWCQLCNMSQAWFPLSQPSRPINRVPSAEPYRYMTDSSNATEFTHSRYCYSRRGIASPASWLSAIHRTPNITANIVIWLLWDSQTSTYGQQALQEAVSSFTTKPVN